MANNIILFPAWAQREYHVIVSLQQENLEGPDTGGKKLLKLHFQPCHESRLGKLKKDKKEQVGATFPSSLAGSIWKPES